MKQICAHFHRITGKAFRLAPLAILLVITPAAISALFTLAAQAPNHGPGHGVVRPLAQVKFEQDEDVKCLVSVLENGDPAAGPSTFLLKAPANCVVPPHYHTAEEQLLVTTGQLSTGMEGMNTQLLGPGGFAMMPSKAPHWFTCQSKDGCLMFVTFDRTYDIVWVKPVK